jgi:hypothetical protein
VLTAIIYRLISAARRRAQENGVEEEEKVFPAYKSPMAGSESETKASPLTNPYESHPESVVTPIATAPVTLTPHPPAIKEDLPYADPVDGMPFEPGEPVVPCSCGLAYREDSVQWLTDYHAGCCIHCGAKVNSSTKLS